MNRFTVLHPPFQLNKTLQACFVLIVAAAIGACNDAKTIVEPAPTGAKLSVCHMFYPGTAAAIIEIYESERAAHEQHGDYVTSLIVDKASTPGDSLHFTTITSAVASVRAGRIRRAETVTAPCRITISVAAGTFTGSVTASTDPTFERFPIIIDVPDISIVGAFRMGLDADGRATGVGTTANTTTLVASPALIVPGTSSQTAASEELFVINATTTASRGDGTVIEGLVMKSGHAAGDTARGGQAVLSVRAQRVTLRGNKFEGNYTERVDFRAGSATIEKNHSSGIGGTCDICLAGPGTFTVSDNRIMEGGGIPGIFTVPATLLPVPALIEQYTLPAASLVTVVIHNNEVRGHQRVHPGVGIRVATMGVFAPNVVSSSKATITNNSLVNNRFGMMFEAGFPVTGGSLKGDLDLSTSGNTFTNSCQNNVLITFTRHTTTLGVNSTPFLRNSTYTLNFGGDISFANAWYGHPAGFDNTLIVNGSTIPNATVHSYDAAKVCPQT